MAAHEDFRKAIEEVALVRRESGTRIIATEGGTTAAWLFDFRSLLLQAKWLDRYADIFWERFGDRYPFQVGAMESAGISLVSAIVMKGVERKTPVNGFYIRKSRKRQGLMKQIEGTLTDEPIVLVDDLVNFGQTLNKQIAILEEAGKRVSDIFVLLSYRDLGSYAFATERGINMSSLFSLRDFGMPLLSAESPKIPADEFETLWRFQAPDPSLHHVIQKSAPVLDDERVYLGSDAGTFFALKQSDGSVAWTFEIKKHPFGKGIFSSPVVDNGTVFFGAYDGSVYALDTATGAKRWEYTEADWVGSSPAIAADLNLLFIGLEFGLFRKRGGIVALDLTTGEERWSQRMPELTHGTPLYSKEENMVIIGSNDSVVYAYDAKTGAMRWRSGLQGPVKSSFAYDPVRRLVLCGCLGGPLYIYSADGTPVYAQPNTGMYATPLVDGGTAYFASLDKTIYALDLDTFRMRWTFETNGRIFASPVIADGALWIGSNDGRLYEIDPDTGSLKRFFQTTERIVNKIAYNHRTRNLFVPTVAGELYCLARKA